MADLPASELISFLRRVRQTRDFRSDAVPDGALRDILDVARWSGSGMNRQPWQFHVVHDRALLEQIAQAAPNAGHVAGAAAAIAISMPGKSPEMDAYDEGRVAERILAAATALGLAAGIGWVAAEGRAEVRRLLGITERRLVRTVVSLGYPSEDALKPKSAPGEARKPLDELVHEVG